MFCASIWNLHLESSGIFIHNIIGKHRKGFEVNFNFLH